MKWKEVLERFRGNKQLPGGKQLFLLFLAGVLLLVIAIPAPKEKEVFEEEAGEEIESGESTLQEYQEYLEKKVASALEYVNGVGRAKVVITLKSGTEKVVEKDQISDAQITSEQDAQGGTRSIEDRSSEKTSVYEQQSDGVRIPYVKKEMTPEVEGVLVIADGGDNAVVARDITEAVQALFGVEAHKIKIMKRTDT